MNDRRKHNDISPVIEYINETANTESSKAELFANFFENQCTQGDDIDLSVLLGEIIEESFDCEIDEDDVLKAPKLLKNCAHSLVKPLAVLFCKSLRGGDLPARLKNREQCLYLNPGKRIAQRITDRL